jgi:quinol-cytochrome oxidoreductase complex cytochrome b subunit
MFFLGMQIVTGLCLAMWYIPSPSMAFSSVEYIMREVHFGWLIRYMHANGAAFMFLVVYLHMLRTLFYGSFVARLNVWFSGFVLLLILILTAFFGYVLPWGQMSFWAATVITSLVSVIPIFGSDLLLILWGGFSIGDQTLTRIYTLHFLLPFVLSAIVVLHLAFLHETGSTDMLGDFGPMDQIPFHPFYTVKDLVGICLFLILAFFLIFFIPNKMGHPVNYIEADPSVTPVHIVPEWYFLPFYGILRSVPSKIGGILILLAALVIFALLPLLVKPSYIRSAEFRIFYRSVVILIVIDIVLIGWFGGLPIESPYYGMCQLLSLFYFILTLVILPLIMRLELARYLNLNG